MRDRRRTKPEAGEARINVYMPAVTKRRVQAFGEALNKSDSRVVLDWIEEKLKDLDRQRDAIPA